jgi:hypothetical protein
MIAKPENRIDHVAWARKINGRWIVHNQLNRTASAYMKQLEETDPERLMRSCRIAHRLVHALEPTEDPKPWFYGGLFSLATRPEAARFLAEHPLLASVVPALQSAEALPPGVDSVSETTRHKMDRLRDALERITKTP